MDSESKAWFIGILTFMVLAMILIVVMIVTEPKTTYEITANNQTYYTDNYQLDNGFVILTDYYSFPLNTHHQEKLTLQGNVKIENR